LISQLSDCIENQLEEELNLVFSFAAGVFQIFSKSKDSLTFKGRVVNHEFKSHHFLSVSISFCCSRVRLSFALAGNWLDIREVKTTA